MIKILVLSRSDLHQLAEDTPDKEVTFNHMSDEAWATGITQFTCVLYQRNNGTVKVLRNKGVDIKTLLEEVLRELPKEENS